LIVLAHPESSSYNAHLATLAQQTLLATGSRVEMSDLYAMGFDPAEDARHFSVRADPRRFDAQLEQRFSYDREELPEAVQGEVDKILRADLVLLHFPLWWFGMPAILKGWMDRVFVYGGMYSGSRRHERGVCRGKRALFCVTTGSSEAACSPTGKEGDTRLVLWPALYSMRYLGFTVLQPFLVHGVRGGLTGPAADAANARLHAIEQRFATVLRQLDDAPVMPFNADTDFDENGQLKPDAPVYSPFIRHQE
jgi:NAD(P)H dehydrogenase (quinone)